MSSVLPRTQQGQLNFFNDRSDVWENNFATLGISDVAWLAFTAGTLAEANAAVENARLKREAAKAATMEADAAMQKLRDEGRAFLRTVQTTAKNATDPDAVYIAAQIPAPSPRTPRSVPAVPTALATSLNNEGGVKLTFKARLSRSGRIQFEIQRQLVAADGSAGQWAEVKTVAEKTWTDPAIPAGTAQASYRVRATNQAGPSEWTEPTTVFFAAPMQAAPGMLSIVGGSQAA